eukprot:2386409-Rhodomonas_salina.2
MAASTMHPAMVMKGYPATHHPSPPNARDNRASTVVATRCSTPMLRPSPSVAALAAQRFSGIN